MFAFVSDFFFTCVLAATAWKKNNDGSIEAAEKLITEDIVNIEVVAGENVEHGVVPVAPIYPDLNRFEETRLV